MCLVCTFQDDLVRARESALWRWQPDGCNLFDFRPARLQQEHNVSSLLANLGQRKIIFVGDSLVLEQYLSLEVRSFSKYPQSAQSIQGPSSQELSSIFSANETRFCGLKQWIKRPNWSQKK